MKKQINKTLAAAIAMASIVSVDSQALPLDFDAGFATNGMLTANYGTGAQSFFEDVEITNDDKIVALGYAQRTDNKYDLLLVKYNLDGTPDTSFGTSGQVNLTVDDDTRGMALVIQPDGKLLVAGHSKLVHNWRLNVQRFNADGSIDPTFTTYTYAPTSTRGGQQLKHDVYTSDIALTQSGKILISIKEKLYETHTNDSLFRSRMLRLQTNGDLDTSFAVNGFTDKIAAGNFDWSFEDSKFALNDSGDIYVAGRRLEAPFADHVKAMTLSKFNANGVAQNFDATATAGTDGWVRRSNYWPSVATPSPNEDKLYSTLVLPNGHVVSVGCTDSNPHSNTGVTGFTKAHVQQQTATGVFDTAFDTDGVIESPLNSAHQRINHCYRDVTYHPSVGLITVGGLKNNGYSSHGSLYVSAYNAATGVALGHKKLGTPDYGYLNATAITSTGKIVSVGYMDLPGGSPAYQSAIMMMQGAPLPTSPDDNIGAFNFTDTTDVALSEQQSAVSSVVTTSTTGFSAYVFDGTAEVNNVAVSNPLTLHDGDDVTLQHTSAATPSTQTSSGVVVNNGRGYHRNNNTWSVGDTFRKFSSTTEVADTTPDVFNFAAKNLVNPNSAQVSDPITVAGINTAADISVVGGLYRINSGAYTDSDGTVNNGDTVWLKHTSSSDFTTDVTSTLTIGGVVSAAFTSTTREADTTPNAFVLQPNGDVTVGVGRRIYSETVVVSGLDSNVSVPISITNGIFAVTHNGVSTTYNATDRTVTNGDFVRVQQFASSNFATQKITTLTIGGISSSLSSTTEAADTTPDNFSFGNSTGKPLATLIETAAITVTGIDSAATISITNGKYKINNGAFTSANGTVNAGDTVTLQHTTASNFSSWETTAVNIGGVSGTYVSKTVNRDVTPDGFSFAAQNNLDLQTLVTSGATNVAGINDAVTIEVTGGEYQINGGAFTSVAGNVNNGDTVTVRHTTANVNSTDTTTTLTIGGISADFVSTTKAAPSSSSSSGGSTSSGGSSSGGSSSSDQSATSGSKKSSGGGAVNLGWLLVLAGLIGASLFGRKKIQ